MGQLKNVINLFQDFPMVATVPPFPNDSTREVRLSISVAAEFVDINAEQLCKQLETCVNREL